MAAGRENPNVRPLGINICICWLCDLRKRSILIVSGRPMDLPYRDGGDNTAAVSAPVCSPDRRVM